MLIPILKNKAGSQKFEGDGQIWDLGEVVDSIWEIWEETLSEFWVLGEGDGSVRDMRKRNFLLLLFFYCVFGFFFS